MINTAEIQARCDAATPGPWELFDEKNPKSKTVCGNNGAIAVGILPKDADFIAYARTDIPALLALNAEKDAEIERLKMIVLRDSESDYTQRGIEILERVMLENEIDRVTRELAQMTAERDRWKQRAEALERANREECVCSTCEARFAEVQP